MSEIAGDAKARVLIVDDHPLVREWLTNLIDQTPDLAVCGEAEDAKTALQLIDSLGAELAVIDLSLGSGSGIDLIRSIRTSHPNIAIIVLSMHDEHVYGERSIRAGARGYIMKRESTNKIVDAIRRVLKGNLYLSQELTELLAEKFVRGADAGEGDPIAQLSDRELEVFQHIGQGYETRDIAKSLNVNIKTVQTYCTRIKDKLKLSTGAELLREAVRWNETSNAR
jgi:DNA-binding NarL/FixJ family response regulator